MAHRPPEERRAREAVDDSARLVGRDRELELVSALLGWQTQPAAPDASTESVTLEGLVLEGVPGVGKTSLWEHAIAVARERGFRLLVARASGSETGLPFAGLIDLLEGVTPEELGSLPVPQRHALEVALYRREPAERPPEQGAIALGLLTTLRTLSERDRILVAVDDQQWLDRASEEALAYAARRLEGSGVTFLLARRPGPRSALEAALADGRLQRVVVGPTSLGGTRQILATRLGVRLPHHVLRRVYDTTLGNPLFVLEVGRLLAGRDPDTLGEDLPVPEDVDELLGLRVADLGESAGRVLLALALDADLKPAQLADVAGPDAVTDAVAAGVVVLDGARVRPTHPLLAAAAKRRAEELELQDLHRRIAAIVPDEQRRALHLALATRDPDDALAGRVVASAELAANRGATRLAVRLGSHSVRLTPEGSPGYVDRVLALGRWLVMAGERQRITDLLGDQAGSLPTSAARVEACLLLTAGAVEDNDDIRALLEQALVEAGDDRQLRGLVLADLAQNDAVIRVVDLPQAHEKAREALAASTPDRPEARRGALYALSWVRALRGDNVDELGTEYVGLTDEHTFLARAPDRIAGQRLVWRGEIGRARELLIDVKSQAEEWAEPSSYALARLHLCELELRAGGADEAQRLLDEWEASTDSLLLHWPMYERCRALLAALRGDPDAARQWAEQALRLADSTGVGWDRLEAMRALGLAALLANDPDDAVLHLSTVWTHTEREGVGDPGAFPVAADLVEALVETGALDTAQEVTARLAELADRHDHPWAGLGARRGTGAITLAAGEYDEAAASALARVAEEYGQLGLTFDAARTWLTLGRAQRRARKWASARESLEWAADGFAALGAPGWVAQAQSDLSRVGPRRSTTPGALTATEQRVAEMAAAGLSNKEIARSLVVTVSTVEFHLRNTYAKLGIRSRVQLARGLLEADDAV